MMYQPERWTTSLTISALLAGLVLSGCDSKPAKPAAPASKPAAPKATVALPDVDMSGLPEGVRAAIMRAYERAKAAPEDAQAMGLLGMELFGIDSPKAAAGCFELASHSAPDELSWAYYWALSLEAAEELDAARQQYKRAIEVDNTYGPIHTQLGSLVIESDVEEAKRLFEKALQLNGNDVIAKFGLAKCSKLMGDRKSSLQQLKELIELEPDYSEAHYYIAMLLQADGKKEEAAKHLELHERKAKPRVKFDPLRAKLMRKGRFGVSLHNEVDQMISQNDLDAAARLLRRAIKRGSADAAVLTKLGVVYSMQGDFEKAAKELRRALREEKNSPAAKTHLGHALAELGKLDEAEQLLREVLAINPNDLPALERLAGVLFKKGENEAALEQLRAATRYEPGNIMLRFRVGQTLASMGKNKEALEHFRFVADKMPDNARLQYTVGLDDMVKGRAEQANTRFRAAIKADPKLQDAYLGLMNVAVAQKNYAAAVDCLREGVANLPDSPTLNNNLGYLLACSPVDSVRNGDQAVEFANKACTLTKNGNASFLDTLAIALAEAGRFDEAVSTLEKALAIAKQQNVPDEALAGVRERLELFKSRKAYRIE